MAGVRVLEVLEAAAGGALRHLFQIAEHIDKDTFELTAAVSPLRMRATERDLARLRAAGVRVELLPMKRRIAPLADAAALRRLARLIREGGFDVVHAHSSKAGFLARVAARRAGVRRVFYTPHAFAFQRGGPLGWCYRQLERLGARFGGVLVAVSPSEGHLALGCRLTTEDRLRVIPNNIPPPPELTAEDRRRARAALALPPDGMVLGTVGRLVPQKDPLGLVEATALLVTSHQARLVFVGDGPLERKTMELAERLGIRDRVLFAGFREEPGPLFAAFDVYVQPSRWEGLPYALLEAMGRGLPVVATDVPGNADLIRKGVTGDLVRPGNPETFAASIAVLLGDEGKRRAMGQAARERVLERHRLDDFVRSIEELYRGG
jgi:glycosyltransferase involved in cell wall biosynthesis